MSIFVTSDTHFNHKNMALIDGKFGENSRGFESVAAMNNKIVENWNNIVTDDDIVYHLGDVAFGAMSDLPPIVEQLNGHIEVARGNHDSREVCDIVLAHGWNVFNSIVICKDGIQFILRHVPNLDWNGDEHHVMLYGHVHSDAPHGLQKNYSYHVGLDTNDLTPVNLDDIIKDVKEGNFVND